MSTPSFNVLIPQSNKSIFGLTNPTYTQTPRPKSNWLIGPRQTGKQSKGNHYNCKSNLKTWTCCLKLSGSPNPSQAHYLPIHTESANKTKVNQQNKHPLSPLPFPGTCVKSNGKWNTRQRLLGSVTSTTLSTQHPVTSKTWEKDPS